MSRASEKRGDVKAAGGVKPGPPFFITRKQELGLRIKASQGIVMNKVPTSLVIGQPTSFDDYVRQLMIPTRVLELARKASAIRFSAWEAEAIRASIAPGRGKEKGLLRKILELKARKDDSHPPYIRVACTGRGDYDEMAAAEYGYKLDGGGEDIHKGEFGSPVVLELWPAQHYSPMHSHGMTTGIIYCLSGQIDVMAYDSLKWEAKKVGLLTLTPGQCAWLDGERFAVHKVFCPMDGGDAPVGPDNLLNDSSNYAATFHVYLNQSELPLVRARPEPDTRDEFTFVDEKTHKIVPFPTYSDISWSILRKVMADYAGKIGM
ncbi:MAG: hypothetical protein JOZ96_08725 [Acidobacteria bacterium]|nr:hypothetical protein [Acidobacteriota bacterium]